MSDLNDWIYIYMIKDGDLLFYLTVSRSSLGLARAKQVVEEIESRGHEAFYTIGTTPKTQALS